MPQQEIERKFRLRKAPRLRKKDGVEIRQGYIVASEGELRIRQAGRKYFLTVKDDGGQTRNEFETRIPEWVFELLWPHTAGRRIEKRRFPFEGGELDVYEGRHKGLVIFEMEFTSERKADRFDLPKTLRSAVEVTDDRAHRNRSLATSEVPPFPESFRA